MEPEGEWMTDEDLVTYRKCSLQIPFLEMHFLWKDCNQFTPSVHVVYCTNEGKCHLF